MLLPFAASCDTAEVTEKIYLSEPLVTNIGGTDFSAKLINSEPDEGEVAIYTRNYKVDGKYSVIVGKEQKERTAVSIRETIFSDGRVEFDVVGRTENFSEAYIPYNGYVLSIPNEMLEGIRCNVGQLVKTNGFELLTLDYERTDLANFSPLDLNFTSSRRISMKNPVNEIEDDKIYFVSSDFTGELPITKANKTVALEKLTTFSYLIKSASSATDLKTPENCDAYMVFTGEYNIAYADFYLKEGEKIMLSSIDKANSYSDLPSLVVDGKTYAFGDELTNVDKIEKDGVYFFDHRAMQKVTPETSLQRKDVVYADGMVVSVGKENARSLIPSGNGFVFSFVGEENCKAVENIEIGNELELNLVEYKAYPQKYVKIGEDIFEIDFLDGYRQPETVCVLYTEAFGKTTGTNQYGTEIAVSNGKVTAVEIGKGNMEIPEDGYVLSIHKDNAMYSKAMSVQTGSDVSISLSGNDYSVTSLDVTGVNIGRTADSLIIYRNSPSTQTNIYGYEICVDADGFAISASTQGDSTIPQGGFVVSGHGVNKDALSEAYTIGEKIIVNKSNTKVYIIKTPDLRLVSAQAALDEVESIYEEAKKNYADLDYKAIDERLEQMRPMFDEAKAMFDSYDYVYAAAYANSIIDTCKELKYAAIESKGVQNRAVWYRSNEKSDDEVRATVEKMKSMNINAIYIETWYDGFCIGKIDVEGVEHQKANGDYDALEGFVRICHENGIEVHAWVEDFFAGHLLADKTYSNNLLPMYKDKILLDSQGNGYWDYTNDYGFVFLNPYDRDCRDLVLSVYKELITKYDIDGIHLDYIRFPEFNQGKYDYGYNEDIIEAFAKKTGVKADPRTFAANSKEKELWIEFRRNIITSFVKEVYDLVRSTRPEVWLSAATYPIQADSRNTIFQDAATWCDNGWMDEIFSMSYGADNAYVRDNVKTNANMTNGKCFYSAGLQAFADTDPTDFAFQMTEAEQVGADGVALFSLGSITPKNYQHQIENGAFRAPSVQCDKGLESYIAQMDYISAKVNNILPICGSFSDGNEKELLDIIASLKDEAKELKGTVKELRNLVKDTESKIAEINNIYGEGDDVKAIIGDIEDTVYWTTLYADRMATR